MQALFVGAGELGPFPKMKMGLIKGDLKKLRVGCCYGYAGATSGDGSPINGPLLAVEAAEKCSFQIKVSELGDKLYFRVSKYGSGEWSEWKGIATVG